MPRKFQVIPKVSWQKLRVGIVGYGPDCGLDSPAVLLAVRSLSFSFSSRLRTRGGYCYEGRTRTTGGRGGMNVRESVTRPNSESGQRRAKCAARSLHSPLLAVAARPKTLFVKLKIFALLKCGDDGSREDGRDGSDGGMSNPRESRKSRAGFFCRTPAVSDLFIGALDVSQRI